MKPFRYTIASLWVAAAVVALDIVWLRYMLTAHRSVFGFFAELADLGIFLMANVLPFGLYPMLHRGGERRRFLVGFEAGGLAAALTFAACMRLAPDAVTGLASVSLDAVWNVLFGWVRNGTIEGLVIYMIFLTAGFGTPSSSSQSPAASWPGTSSGGVVPPRSPTGGRPTRPRPGSPPTIDRRVQSRSCPAWGSW